MLRSSQVAVLQMWVRLESVSTEESVVLFCCLRDIDIGINIIIDMTIMQQSDGQSPHPSQASYGRGRPQT